MLSTYLSYQLITKDMPKALDRVENQPMVERETKYYQENISKVTSIDEFVKNDRLFRYAMKAHGLEDMSYAKAFMVKALKEGIKDEDSFANKLSDKRYADFVKTYNFAEHGALATSFNAAQHTIPKNYTTRIELAAVQNGLTYMDTETTHFVENIGQVTSIDDLMGNERLLKYAMGAYGLDAGEEPAATVRQMLEGGVTDPQSPANRLADKRYAAFVSAFDFVQHGAETTQRHAVVRGTPETFLAGSGLTLFDSRKDDAETTHFRANIGDVKSVRDLIGNPRLLAYALTAHGLNPKTEDPVRIIALLQGGVSDPDSPANQLTDKRYANFVSTFNFVEHGAETTSRNAVQFGAPEQYVQNRDPEAVYYRANIANVRSIDQFVSDRRLANYAMKAFGLDPATDSRETLKTMLQGGVADPNSPANLDKRYTNIATAFDFAQYGADTTTRDVVQTTVPQRYAQGANSETAYFRANIMKVDSVNAMMRDDRLLTYAMSAYGLNSDVEDPALIRRMLEEGVRSPTSLANLNSDTRYRDFVAAFDFEQYGAETVRRDAVQVTTVDKYDLKAQFGLIKPGSAHVEAETTYYNEHVKQLKSIDDLLADKRLLNFALTSFGIDPTHPTEEMLRAVLEGGVSDPNSLANKVENKAYASFVSAFNFAEYGEEATTRVGAQDVSIAKYMRQTLEENAGEDNEGVRLALYFERKAPELTNFYEVLADPALSRVVRTALSLPDSFASADIDKQVQLFEDKLDIADLSDPEELGKFLTRFTSLWEIQNPSAPAQASMAVLFSQPVEFGISTNTMFAIQALRK